MRPGSVPIVIIDGPKLIEVMLEKRIAVRREPLSIERVDESFFVEFDGRCGGTRMTSRSKEVNSIATPGAACYAALSR